MPARELAERNSCRELSFVFVSVDELVDIGHRHMRLELGQVTAPAGAAGRGNTRTDGEISIAAGPGVPAPENTSRHLFIKRHADSMG